MMKSFFQKSQSTQDFLNMNKQGNATNVSNATNGTTQGVSVQDACWQPVDENICSGMTCEANQQFIVEQ